MLEEWKDIPTYENRYQVSSFGRVRSLISMKLLKPMKHYRGHLYVHLYNKHSVRDQIFVHRLVAMVFIDNWDDLAFVNHRHGDKTDNRATELEWTSPSGNTIHYYKGVETMEERNAAF